MTWKTNILVVANVTATSDELLDMLKVRAEREACAFTLDRSGDGVRRWPRGGARRP